jgi:hypothetical protein
VAPFIALIREPYLAGPYKLIALDSVQMLLSCNILLGCEHARDTLSEIVDAVTRFYILTPAARNMSNQSLDLGVNSSKLTQLETN